MKALVLCGGYGTRLGTLTATTPKPMLTAGDRTLLEWILLHLAASGVTDALVNLHFHGDSIRSRIGDGARLGLHAHYVDEPKLLGTAGTAKANRDFLSSDGPFLVHYGDVVHDGDLVGLIAQHQRTKALATIGLHRRRGSNSHVRLGPGGCVESFVERPSDEERRHLGDDGLVFSGVCMIDEEALSAWSSAEGDLPRDVFPSLVGTGRLIGRELGGHRVAVDSPERLALLDRLLRSGECVPGRLRQAT